MDRLKRTALGRFARGYLIDAEAGDMAAVVAFHALLYVFPLLGALLTAIGLVVQDEQRLLRTFYTIVRILPAANWPDSLQGLLLAKQNAGLFGIVSAVGLFWLGSSLIASLARAFNKLYGVPSRALVQQRLLAMGLIITMAALLIVTVAASSVAAVLVNTSENFLGLTPLGYGLTGSLLALGTGLSTAFVLFLLLYWAVPNLRLSFGDVWPGAFFAACLFVAATQLFPLYARYAPTNRYAGFLSLVFLLTTWFYVLAHILLLGAALNAFRRGKGPRPRTT
jgi:membrane protein